MVGPLDGTGTPLNDAITPASRSGEGTNHYKEYSSCEWSAGRPRPAHACDCAWDGRGRPSLHCRALALDLYRLYYDVFVGTILTIARCLRDFFDDIVSLDYLAENCVLAGEPFAVAYGDEELRAVRVGAGIGHREFPRLVELVRRTLGLVFELVAGAAHAGALRVSALNHEAGNHPMKNRSVIKRVVGFLACGGVLPFALALCEVDKIRDGLGGILFVQTANDIAFAGFKHRIGSGCAGQSLPSILKSIFSLLLLSRRGLPPLRCGQLVATCSLYYVGFFTAGDGLGTAGRLEAPARWSSMCVILMGRSVRSPAVAMRAIFLTSS